MNENIAAPQMWKLSLVSNVDWYGHKPVDIRANLYILLYTGPSKFMFTTIFPKFYCR